MEVGVLSLNIFQIGFLKKVTLFLACVASVIGEGKREQGRRKKMRPLSFLLAFLAPLPLPRLRRPRRLQFSVLDAILNPLFWNDSCI